MTEKNVNRIVVEYIYALKANSSCLWVVTILRLGTKADHLFFYVKNNNTRFELFSVHLVLFMRLERLKHYMHSVLFVCSKSFM